MKQIKYYDPELQPDILGGENSFADSNYTSYDVFEKLYEPLRAAYPDNIRREHIGKDASGKYDMWCYIFEPAGYEKTIYLSAGVHGRNEIQSYMGLARLMHLTYNESDACEQLSFLRNKVRFITVPIVNVWDVTVRAKGEDGFSPNNSNNVNLNRNWKGDDNEQEVKNVKALVAKYKDEIDFGFDLHTDPEGMPGWGSYMLIYGHGMDKVYTDRLLEVADYLDRKNPKRREIKVAFRGDDLNYPSGSSWDVNTTPDYKRQDLSSSCSSVLWREFGIPTAVPEHGDRKFSPVRGDAVDMTRAIELYANHILGQLDLGIE